MKPQGPRREAMRKKRYLLTNRFTTINTGPSRPNTSDTFAYRARARPLDEDNFAKLFGLVDEGQNEPRLEALKLREKILAELEDVVDPPIQYVKGKLRKVFLFWNRNRTQYFFVEVIYFHSDPPRFRRSFTCPSRDLAHTWFFSDMLSWHPFETLSPET